MNPNLFWNSSNCPRMIGSQNPSFKHGLEGTRTYRSWQGMKRRCLNENNPDYPNYGGRGIKICDQWINSFETFLKDMGECVNNLSLDRIDTNGDYEPNNCRWATQKQQCRNLRKNILFTANGNTMTLAQWSEELGRPYTTLYSRITKLNWTPSEALK